MKITGFSEYVNSGHISKKQEMQNHMDTISARIAQAKKIKGALCLNNGRPNGGTWKTPLLDHALKSKSGF